MITKTKNLSQELVKILEENPETEIDWDDFFDKFKVSKKDRSDYLVGCIVNGYKKIKETEHEAEAKKLLAKVKQRRMIKMQEENETKMLCPKCKMEIDQLDFDVTATCSSTLYAEDVEKEDLDCVDTDALTDNMEFDNFRCPECQENLFTEGGNEEEQAIKFLKGGK